MRLKDYIFAQRRFVNYSEGTDLTNLGIGAALHDLGKLGLAPEWHSAHFFDKRTDTNEYCSHAERGYRAVQGRIEATASAAVLHHHQRFDGQGFPKLKPRYQTQWAMPLAGQSIHIFSRIVAMANAIDGVINASRKRNAPIASALATIQQPAFDGVFDPVVLDAALRVIPPFPLGACVELSDGRQAVVTDLNESKSCQPTVRLLRSPSNANDEGHDALDLAAPGAPSIVRVGNQTVNGVPYTLEHPPATASPSMKQPLSSRRCRRHVYRSH